MIVKKLLSMVLFFILTEQVATATTIFSRQYDMKCGGCHIGVPPTLNKTGERFLRNGMRFSQGEATTLQRFLSEEDSVAPFGLFAGVGTKNIAVEMLTKKGRVTQENEVVNPTFTPFIAGSISENFSTFIGARFVYAPKSPTDDTRELTVNRSKVYLQYNQDDNFVVRAGIIYAYPETSQNSGLSDVPDLYISILDRGILKPLHGAETLYYTQNGFTFGVAGGVIGDSNAEQSMLAKLEYTFSSFKSGVIVNNITETKSELQIARYKPSEITLGERLSIMAPLEYEFEYGYVNVTGLYEKNERAIQENYRGVESSLTLPLFESGNIRYIYTHDNEESKGHSFRYAHILYDRVFLNANYAEVEAQRGSFDSLVFGLNLIY